MRLAVGLAVVLMACGLSLITPGCSAGPQAIVVVNDGIEYRCEAAESPRGPVTVISKSSDPSQEVFRTGGRAVCAAISPNGALLAVALRRDASVVLDVRSATTPPTIEVAFVKTATLQEVRRWAPSPPIAFSSDPQDLDVSRLANLAFTRDGQSVVLLWTHRTHHGLYASSGLHNSQDGRPLQCVSLKPSASANRNLFRDVDVGMGLYSAGDWFQHVRDSDLIYCGEGVPLALSREFLEGVQAHRFTIKHGECPLSHPREQSGNDAGARETRFVLRGVCFNDARSRVAGWLWSDPKRTAANVAVWSIPEGELLSVTRTEGQIREIACSSARNAFKITLADGREVYAGQEPADDPGGSSPQKDPVSGAK